MSAHRKKVGPEITEIFSLQEHTSFLARAIQEYVGAGSSTRDRASDGSARLRTRPPVGEGGEEIGDADVAVAVEVPRALSGGGSIKEVCRAGVDTVVVVPDGPDGGSGVADRDPVAEEVECTTRRTVNWSDWLGGVHWTAVFGAVLLFAIMVVTIVRIGRR